MTLDASDVRRWSTDAVCSAQRLDYWVGAICEAFLEMDCSSSQPRLFEGDRAIPLSNPSALVDALVSMA